MYEGIELDVFAPGNLTVPLTNVPRRWQPTFLEELNRDGGGSFRVRADDPIFDDAANALDEGNLVRHRLNGNVEWWEILRKQNVDVSEGEYAGEWIEVSGPGARSWSTHAVVYPEYGLVKRPNDRAFNFASKQGSWYAPAQWVAATQTGAVLTSPWYPKDSPQEWPAGLTAQWIWDRPVTSLSTVHPDGDCYFRHEFTLATATKVKLFGTADNYAAFLIDGARVLSVTEFGSWAKTFSAEIELEAGSHVLAVRARNAGGFGGLVYALCRVKASTDGKEVTYVDADKVLASGTATKVMPYPAAKPGWTIGQILNTLLDEAVARGVDGIARISRTWTNSADSNGVAWDGTHDLVFNLGISYADVLTQISDGYADVWFDGLSLNVAQSRGVDRSVSVAGADPVTFRAGLSVLGSESQSTAEIANIAVVNTDDGMVERPGPAGSLTQFGRRESYLTSSGTIEGTAAPLIDQLFTKYAQPRRTPTLQIVPTAGNIPWVDFGVGDWVLAPTDDGGTDLIKRRIVSLSVEEDEETGEERYSAEIDTIQQTVEERLARWLQSVDNGSKQGGVSGTSSPAESATSLTTLGSGSGTPPMPSLPAAANPAAPTNLVVTTDTYLDELKKYRGKAILNWQHSGQDENGRDILLSGYDIAYKVSGSTDEWYITAATDGENIVVAPLRIMKPDLSGPESFTFVVRARSAQGRSSPWSQAVSVAMKKDTTAPLAPYFQTSHLETWLSTVTVTWNGKLTTNGTDQVDPPADMEHVNVYENTTALAAGRVKVGEIWGPTIWQSPHRTADVGLYYTLTAVDASGNESPHSAARLVTPKANVDIKLITAAINGAEIQITNIGSAAITDGAILEAKLADNAVALEKLKDGAVSLTKLNTEVNDKITKGITDAATAQTKANTADSNAGKAQAAADKALAEAKKNNLILNGDLEDPLSTYGSAYRVALASAHSGGYGAGLLSDQWRTIYWNIVPVIQGQLLEARCWVKDDGDTGNCKVSFAFDKFGPDGVELTGDLYPATIISDPLPTGTWQEAVVRFAPIPAGVSFVRLRTTSSGTVWGTAKVYIDDVWMGDVAAMAAAEAAQAKADSAFADAGEALTAAGNAQNSANGKNNVYYLAALPSGTGFANGDTVFIRAAVGQPITAQHTWEKTGPTTGSWKLETLSHQVIASVDLGKATIGELDGIYVKAKSLEADKLVVGRGANLLVDPDMLDQPNWSGGFWQATGGYGGKGSLFIPQNSLQSGGYYAQSATANQRRLKLVPGATYRLGGWVKVSAAAPIKSVKLYLRGYDDATANTLFADVANNIPENRVALVADTWTYISGMVTVPLTETKLNGVLGAFKQAVYTTGTTRWSDLTIQQAMTGEFVLDGTLTAGKINIAGNPADPTEVSLTANLAKLMKLEVSNLIATTGNLDSAVINKLWVDVVNSQKITADMMVVGMGENSIVDPYLMNAKTNDLKLANAGAGWSWISGGADGNVYRHSHQGTGSPWVEMSPSWIDVEPGKSYRFAYSMGGVSSVGNTPSLQATYAGRRADGTTTYVTWPGSVAGTYASGWTTVEQEMVIPSDIVQIKPRIRGNASGVGIVYVRFSHLGRKMDASLIVDGAIAARHLTATESLWAKVIGTHKIEALEIDTNDLTSDTGFIGHLDTNYLTTNKIKAVHIDATAGITSRHTITGATLQTTATANAGIKFTSASLKAYGAGGVETFSMLSSTGSVAVTNGTITGGTVQTSATAARGVKINSSGLLAYSSTGKLKFVLDASEGDIQMDSRVIVGDLTKTHWVIVPWESATQERAAIWLSNAPSGGLGGSETAGFFMDDADDTVNKQTMHIRGMNSGNVEVDTRLVATDFYSSVIYETTGAYKLQAANGSYFNGSLEARGTLYAKLTSATTIAANAYIDGTGQIWKTSSAARFKVDPQPMDLPDSLLDVPVEDWIDRGQLEYMQKLEAGPRPFTESEQAALDGIILDRIPGVIAEKVEAAGGSRFVGYGTDGLLESVAYDRLALARTAVLKRQLDAALVRIAALESK